MEAVAKVAFCCGKVFVLATFSLPLSIPNVRPKLDCCETESSKNTLNTITLRINDNIPNHNNALMLHIKCDVLKRVEYHIALGINHL